MKILAIDTATEACSAALYLDGVCTQRYALAPRQHAELILGMCAELLAEAGVGLKALDSLAFGRGPGAFTGLRIAAGVIQGMAWANALPVVPVSSLAALSYGAWREHGHEKLMAAIDARIHEVYWGCYECNESGVMLVGEEQVCAAANTLLPAGQGWVGIGSGWAAYEAELSRHSGAHCIDYRGDVFPQAQDIARLAASAFSRGEAVSAEQALPVYIRDNVAKKKKDQR
ncbi:tRNA (adenosine(37)-N6)-threonylcarbamoyltransferase complex dimerization subunit type 1 TsaB [Sulfuriflexus mobilis]|uniref:tRNA (adenosine(37)-N6)-threonylcarbamoyltransferase complex dimerization subunit type 1 TsaB n=1 Tax=Sulfuriflexus mobilis TaxID=1811807 RepID=UPI000F82350C|nr:tRNA (adenosine(37)-N6)-threonylcarbamoyltransferase complex dimerization subunit type 1 TsaB [Sulfuriflexus mobilis]